VLDITELLAKSDVLRIPFWFYSLALLVLAEPVSDRHAPGRTQERHLRSKIR